jgi:hypothetical protein
MQVKYLPVPAPVLLLAGCAAAAVISVWAVQQWIALRRGQMALGHTMYLISHHLTFLTGYLLIEDITVGWLVLNAWHNAQYILLVWSYNNMRFRGGIDPRHWFLSTISQSRHMIAYFAVCLGISTLVYLCLYGVTVPISAATAVPVTLIVFMVINFHHYIVDGIIWKVRRPKLQENLGIAR